MLIGQERPSLPSPSLLHPPLSCAHTAAHVPPFWETKPAPFWVRREKPESRMLLSFPWLQPSCQTLRRQLPSSREDHSLTFASFPSNISQHPCFLATPTYPSSRSKACVFPRGDSSCDTVVTALLGHAPSVAKQLILAERELHEPCLRHLTHTHSCVRSRGKHTNSSTTLLSLMSSECPPGDFGKNLSCWVSDTGLHVL